MWLLMIQRRSRSPKVLVMIAWAMVLLPTSIVSAQGHGAYAGGTLVLHTQLHSATDESPPEPLGGTTWGASALVGAWLSPHVAIEFEPCFSGSYSQEFTYAGGISFRVDEVARRRDSFLSVQLRTRLAAVEPVVGLSPVVERLSRHATVMGTPYFDESHTEYDVAAVVGLDVPLKLASHFALVPTFRMFIAPGRSSGDSTFEPLLEDTGTGALVFRYGVGGRVVF
jgi:hypothetical protein